MVISSNLKEMKDKKTGVEIISVHVPKTAGSAFTRVLFKVYGPEAVFLDYPYEKDYQRQFMKEGDANVKVIHGHFPGAKYKHKFDDAKRIIWLREPVSFLISYYCFNKIFRRTVFYNLLQEKNLSFWEFAQLPENQNLMSVYLREMKLEDFFFAGIQEFFEEDLQQLKTLLSWPDVTISRENNNTYSDYQRIKKEVLSDRSLIKKVETLNNEDMELYQQALNLREKRSSQTWQKPQKTQVKQQKNQQVRGVVKNTKIEEKSNFSQLNPSHQVGDVEQELKSATIPEKTVQEKLKITEKKQPIFVQTYNRNWDEIYDELFWGYKIQDIKEQTHNEDTINISGWVLGKKCPIVAVEVAFLSSIIKKVSVNQSYPNIVKRYPKASQGAEIGFNIEFILKKLPRKFNWLIQAVFADETRMPIGSIQSHKQKSLNIPQTPLITKKAIEFLEKFFLEKSYAKVLEFGSGASTIWLSKLTKNLTSIEHDAGWFQQVKNQIQNQKNCYPVDLRLLARPYHKICANFPEASFDLIIVDGRDRMKCFEASIKLLKPGGILMLDDAQREKYKQAQDLLRDWQFTKTISKDRHTYWWQKPFLEKKNLDDKSTNLLLSQHSYVSAIDTDSQVEIISVHVPKTAGTTLRRCLIQVYGDEQILFDYRRREVNEVLSEIKNQNIRVIHGHFLPQKYCSYFPGAKKIIWIREPIKRLISHYWFYLTIQKRKKVTDTKIALVKERFFIWAKIPYNINLMSRHCMQENIGNFWFVGITEFLREDLTEIKTMLEWPEIKIGNANKHNNPKQYQTFVETVLSDRKLIEELNIINSQDIELYERALTLREKRIKTRI